ncbi:hypothetical protein FACS1894214_0970 [Planctomycetales bacterium]|nr:hypothetical protein FACS1894214_0970 [Planctomycetales bacterium]
MKRNNDLIREILLIAEAHTDEDKMLEVTPADFIKEFSNITQYEIDEHVRLLKEKGLIETHHNRGGWYIKRLTWDGHDFLGNARDITVWNQAKQIAATSSWDVFSSVLKEFALKGAMLMLKQSIGYNL